MLYFIYSHYKLIIGIALPIIAGLWAFAKYIGRTGIEEYVRRRGKKSELKAEKPYKEEDTRYGYLHPKRGDAAITTFELCRQLAIAFDQYITVVKSGGEDADNIELRKLRHEVKQPLNELLSKTNKAITDNRLIFKPETRELLGRFLNYVWKLSATDVASKGVALVDIENAVRDKLNALDRHFQQMLDSDK